MHQENSVAKTKPAPSAVPAADILDRSAAVPLYLQLKAYFAERILQGDYTGSKLPTVRDAASSYGVSMNTVLRAYEGLRQEGYISGTVGRGTFVTTTKEELHRHNRGFQLQTFIRHALEEALSFGYTLDDFAREVESFIARKRENLAQIQLIFIECNIEQLRYFTEHLDLDPSIHRIPLLLTDLQEGIRSGDKTVLDTVKKSDLILTSFYHMREVAELIHRWEKPLIGINLEPEISTIVEIAKIPTDSTIGIVTSSEKFLNIIKEELHRLNLNFSSILETTSRDEETIMHLVSRCSTILVSPKQKRIVSQYVGKEQKIIEFIFTPDRTSINNIKVAVMELHAGDRFRVGSSAASARSAH